MTFEHKPKLGYPPLDPKRCKASVGHGDRAPTYSQCQRKRWKNGWCKQHHPSTEAAKKKAWEEQYEKESRQHQKQYAIERAERRVVNEAIKCVKHGWAKNLEKAVKRLLKLRGKK